MCFNILVGTDITHMWLKCRSARCRLVSVSIFVALVWPLLGTSSHSTRCILVSVSLFVALVSLGPGPRVILLVVDSSPSQSLSLWFA